jgi:hypothetical protein
MKIMIMSDDANWEPTLKAVVDHLPEKAPVLPDPDTSDTESSDETMEMASPLAVDPLVYVLSGAVFGAALVYAFSKAPVLTLPLFDAEL